MYELKIIIASTRPGRKGPSVASWIVEKAKDYKEFNVELLNLAVINLPMMDEPEHPRLKKYQHEHTKKWSNIINGADAFIFVTAEYNYGYPAPLKNAIDYLSKEWAYKPLGFVSYGGIAAGTRALQSLRGVVSAVKLIAIDPAVNIPFFAHHIDEHGIFKPNDSLNHSSDNLFQELLKWAPVLKEMRGNR